jgi:hypothetical protein
LPTLAKACEHRLRGSEANETKNDSASTASCGRIRELRHRDV